MPELGSLGSVRGALSNERPYRECGNSDYADSVVAVGAIESSMTHISGFERSQILLLPEAVDDYVGADKRRAIRSDDKEHVIRRSLS